MPAKTFLAILLLTMAHFFCMKTLCLIKSTKNMLLQKTGTTDSINEAPFFFFSFLFCISVYFISAEWETHFLHQRNWIKMHIFINWEILWSHCSNLWAPFPGLANWANWTLPPWFPWPPISLQVHRTRNLLLVL